MAWLVGECLMIGALLLNIQDGPTKKHFVDPGILEEEIELSTILLARRPRVSKVIIRTSYKKFS